MTNVYYKIIQVLESVTVTGKWDATPALQLLSVGKYVPDLFFGSL